MGVSVISGGFFHCGHCNHVVEPSAVQIEAAENAPAGSLLKLKCPRCHKHEVGWKVPAVSRSRPVKRVPVYVSAEQGKELFKQLREQLAI